MAPELGASRHETHALLGCRVHGDHRRSDRRELLLDVLLRAVIARDPRVHAAQRRLELVQMMTGVVLGQERAFEGRGAHALI